jgi:hypothetical protein
MLTELMGWDFSIGLFSSYPFKAKLMPEYSPGFMKYGTLQQFCT